MNKALIVENTLAVREDLYSNLLPQDYQFFQIKNKRFGFKTPFIQGVRFNVLDKKIKSCQVILEY
jgi:hypothetical protein